MQHRYRLALIVVFVLAAGGLLYAWLRPVRSLSALVPPDALVELESTHLLDSTSTRIERRQLTLNQIPLFEQAVANLARPFFAVTDSVSVRRFMRGRVVRSSLHPTGKSSLEFIFYVTLQTDADRQFVDQLFQAGNTGVRVLTRPFNNEPVRELVNRSNQSLGHFLAFPNALIVSSSGVLVENVVRQASKFSFWKSDRKLLKDRDQIAAVSVQPDVLQQLFGKDNGSLVRLFLPQNLTVFFRSTASPTHLVGHATDQLGNRADVASLFLQQEPQRMAAGDLIPQSTSSLYHFSVSNGATFGQSIRELMETTPNDQLEDRLERIETESELFYKSLGKDVLLCQLESPGGGSRQVLVLAGGDGAKLAQAYQQIARLSGLKTPASVKKLWGHNVLRLNVRELPATLFTNLFAGFRESWVTQHGSALLVANSEAVMQEYLQQVNGRAVWSADERQRTLLGNVLREAHFTAFSRLNRNGQVVPQHWPAAWSNLLGRPESSFDRLENLVYQAQYGNEHIISTLVLGRTTRRASSEVLNQVLLQKKVEFNAPLIAAPVVVGSLATGSAQFYAQNQAGQFVLVTPDGDKIVQDTTDGPIRSNVLVTDFLNNGRLQYLFMTDRRLYVVQPGRQSVRLTPIRLPAGLDPSFLAQPQGSRNANIVALTAHRDGSVYGLDRQRKSFVKLMTAPVAGPLLLPFQVLNTATGMEVLAMQGNGTLNRWQDNGQPVTHFPAKLDLPFVSPVLQPANADYIQAITEGGELLRLNANGLIAGRNQLYRPIRAGTFRLLPDENGQTWLLLRSSDTEVTFLDQQGEVLFSVRGLEPDQTTIRYHRLGGGIELISIKSGDQTTLYKTNGQKVGIMSDEKKGIPSDFPVALQFDELSNELYVLTGVKQAVQLFSIRMR